MTERMERAIYRALAGLCFGSVGGGVAGAFVFWFTARLRENPEEPAWLFVNTLFGLVIGALCGSIFGLIIAVVAMRGVPSKLP